MTVCPTLELGHPLLRQLAQPVESPLSSETQQLIADLWDTLRDFRQRNRWGRALSAPVIGVAARVVVVEYGEQQYVLINPRFERWSRTQVVAYESCVTFGGLWGQVSRPARVVVLALDAAGREQRYDLDGELGRIVQHEIDHLDGLVWLDRDPDLTTICTNREYQRQRQAQQPDQPASEADG